MEINSIIDSNAVALSMRNFGSMPKEIAEQWISQFALQKQSDVPLPTKAIIEIANTCNLDCPICRVGQYGVNINRILSLDKFKSILDQLKGVKIVRLNGLGESTLVPDFEKYLQLLFDRGITVELISNGSGKLEYYESILQNNGVVLISFDAGEKEIFESLRRPANWETYTDKLISLSKFAISIKAVDRLFLLFTLQKQNIKQTSKLVEKCIEWNIHNIIVNVVKLSQTDWIQQRIAEIKNDFAVASQLAEQNGIALLLPSKIEGINLELKNSIQTSACNCRMPWEEIVIRWNGDVQVCNMFNPYTYGNIFLNDLETIWNNSFANLFRNFINTKMKHPYCNGCVYIKDAYDYRKN